MLRAGSLQASGCEAWAALCKAGSVVAQCGSPGPLPNLVPTDLIKDGIDVSRDFWLHDAAAQRCGLPAWCCASAGMERLPAAGNSALLIGWPASCTAPPPSPSPTLPALPRLLCRACVTHTAWMAVRSATATGGRATAPTLSAQTQAPSLPCSATVSGWAVLHLRLGQHSLPADMHWWREAGAVQPCSAHASAWW